MASSTVKLFMQSDSVMIKNINKNNPENDIHHTSAVIELSPISQSTLEHENCNISKKVIIKQSDYIKSDRIQISPRKLNCDDSDMTRPFTPELSNMSLKRDDTHHQNLQSKNEELAKSHKQLMGRNNIHDYPLPSENLGIQNQFSHHELRSRPHPVAAHSEKSRCIRKPKDDNVVKTSIMNYERPISQTTSNNLLVKNRHCLRKDGMYKNRRLSSFEYERLSEFAALFVYDVWFLNQPESENSLEQERFTHFINYVVVHASIAIEVVHLALYYIYQVKEKCRTTLQILGSEYPLLTVCLSIANKCLDDHAYLNSVWSKLTKIPVNILNQVEKEILDTLNYKISLSSVQYLRWSNYIHYTQNSDILHSF